MTSKPCIDINLTHIEDMLYQDDVIHCKVYAFALRHKVEYWIGIFFDYDSNWFELSDTVHEKQWEQFETVYKQLDPVLPIEEYSDTWETKLGGDIEIKISSEKFHELIKKEVELRKMNKRQDNTTEEIKENQEDDNMGVYIVSNKSFGDEIYKIGYSRDVDARIKQLNTSTPYEFEKELVLEGGMELEKELSGSLEEVFR